MNFGLILEQILKKQAYTLAAQHHADIPFLVPPAALALHKAELPQILPEATFYIADFHLPERNIELPASFLCKLFLRITSQNLYKNYKSFMCQGALEQKLYARNILVNERHALLYGAANLVLCSKKILD